RDPRHDARRRDDTERPFDVGRSEPDRLQAAIGVEGEDHPADDDVVFDQPPVADDAGHDRALEAPVAQEGRERRPPPVAVQRPEEAGEALDERDQVSVDRTSAEQRRGSAGENGRSSRYPPHWVVLVLARSNSHCTAPRRQNPSDNCGPWTPPRPSRSSPPEAPPEPST